MDDRDRTAPIALPRHAPIAQAVGDRALAAAKLFEPLADRALGLRNAQAIEEIGVEGGAVLDIGDVADREMRRVLPGRQYHRDDREIVFAGEFEVALVMRRAAEDRAGAVFHQHEIGDIDRTTPARVERVDRLERRAVAALLGRLDDRLAGAEAVAFGNKL